MPAPRPWLGYSLGALPAWGLGTHEGASPQTLGRSAMKPSEFKTSCRGRGGMGEEDVEDLGEGRGRPAGTRRGTAGASRGGQTLARHLLAPGPRVLSLAVPTMAQQSRNDHPI